MRAISNNWPPVLPSLELLDPPTRNRVAALHTSLLPHHAHIATYASSLHPNKTPCKVISDKYTWGQTFLVYEVLFGSGDEKSEEDDDHHCESWVVRFAMGMDGDHEAEGNLTSPEQLERKILNEVASLHLVRERTSIPVPEVLGYCANSGTAVAGHPLGEGFPPFVLMTAMKGKTIEDLGVNLYDLGRHWTDDEDLDDVITDDYAELSDEIPQEKEVDLEFEFEKMRLATVPSPTSTSLSSPAPSQRHASRTHFVVNKLSSARHSILRNYLRSLASIHLQLSQITFNKIGSFVISPSSSLKDNGGVTIGPGADFGLGPFDTAEEYFAMQAEAYKRLAWAVGDSSADSKSCPPSPLSPSPHSPSAEPSTPLMKRLFTASLYTEAIDLLRRAHLDPKPLASNQGPFPMTHGDLHSENILVDDEGFIVGVLDWDCAGTVPWEKAAVAGFEVGGGFTLTLGSDSGLDRVGRTDKRRGGVIHRMYNNALAEVEAEMHMCVEGRRSDLPLNSKGSLSSLASVSEISSMSSEVSSSSPWTSSSSLLASPTSSPATSPTTSPYSSMPDLTLTPTCSNCPRPAFLTEPQVIYTAVSNALPIPLPSPSSPSLLQMIHSHLTPRASMRSSSPQSPQSTTPQRKFGSKSDFLTTIGSHPRRSIAELHDSLAGYVTSYLGHWMYALGCDYQRTGKALFGVVSLLRRSRGDLEEESMEKAFERFVKGDGGGGGGREDERGLGKEGVDRLLDELD